MAYVFAVDKRDVLLCKWRSGAWREKRPGDDLRAVIKMKSKETKDFRKPGG